MPSLDSVTYFFFHSLFSEFPLRFSKMPWWRWENWKVRIYCRCLACSSSFQQHDYCCLPKTPTVLFIRPIWEVTTLHHRARWDCLHIFDFKWLLLWCPQQRVIRDIRFVPSLNLCPTCLMGMERPLPRSPLQSALLLFESLPLRPWTGKRSNSIKCKNG